MATPTPLSAAMSRALERREQEAQTPTPPVARHSASPTPLPHEP